MPENTENYITWGELQILNNNCYINEEKIWIKVFW